MKIKKINTLTEDLKALTEDTDDTPDITLADVDVQTASAGELATAIQGEVAANSAGEDSISHAEAAAMADDIQAMADTTGAEEVIITPEDFDSIVIENRLVDALNASLANARRDMRLAKKGIAGTGHNILVEGLPGSGKTAIIKA